MKKPLIILLAVALLALIVVAIVIKQKSTDESAPKEIRGVAGEPFDIVMDFYRSWYEARNSSSSDPFSEGLPQLMSLGIDLSKKIADSEINFRESGTDIVLCQTEIPGKLRSRIVFVTDTSAQIMILPKDNQSGIIPVATLNAHDGLWEITDIVCNNGEQDPNQGEFSFDREGQLLKASLQPPLDNQYWHLVFEQDGTFGYTAPLFLNDSSICVLNNGSEEACRDDIFSETQKVHVLGNMTEAGVEVKKIEIKQ